MSGRVAITGADGMLGTELVRVAGERAIDIVPWTLEDFDVTDTEAVRQAVVAARPRVVIHTAAWTDVDGCESDPETAFRVNARGTALLAQACREVEARLIMVSTDYVFGGSAPAAYREGDPPGPLSVYGWSKLAGEEVVRALGSRGIVARTAWLYADHGQNFLRTMLRLGRERSEISVVDDQIGSPTFAYDLARALFDLSASDASGTFHVTNTGSVSWHGFARRIFETAGLPVELRAVTSTEFPRPAPRPANSVLAAERLGQAGIAPLRSWEEGLEACLLRLEVGSKSDRAGA